MRGTVYSIGLIALSLAGAGNARAVLAPSKPSQLVTLARDFFPPANHFCAAPLSEFFKIDAQVNADGSVTAFSIPEGMVLVVTGLEWLEAGGTADVDRLVVDLQPAGAPTAYRSVAFGTGVVGTTSGGGSISFQPGIAVNPGSDLCVGVLRPGALHVVTVHGYLTKDK
jgi:hypothetical protein